MRQGKGRALHLAETGNFNQQTPYMDKLIEVFSEIRECDYKGEHYSVRDNGAVMRHPQVNRKPRPKDNIWTFGTRDSKTAYMLFGTHRIHIIVANAFLGERDSRIYVVDHIDTNRCNNRVENLRWFTRLENALNNPITRKRIEMLCGGDIQKFIDDPSCLRTDNPKAQDLSWMRTVSSQEAKTAMENLTRWVHTMTTPSTGNTDTRIRDKEWMFRRNIDNQYRDLYAKKGELANGTVDKTKIIRDDRPMKRNYDAKGTLVEYLLLSSEDHIDLEAYFAKLVPGAVFSKTPRGYSNVINAMLAKDKSSIGVAVTMPSDMKPFAAYKIFCVDGEIVHEFLHTCFEKNGALQRMTEAVGEKWTGPDSIDNYC